MISNTDLEEAWFLYKTEAQPKGMSTNEFCQIKGIPYHEFEKWYKKTHRTVAPVEIVGKPAVHEETNGKDATEKVSRKTKVSGKGDLLVTIKNRRGLCLRQGGLDYEGLKLLVERLKGNRTYSFPILKDLANTGLSKGREHNWTFTFNRDVEFDVWLDEWIRL